MVIDFVVVVEEDEEEGGSKAPASMYEDCTKAEGVE